MSELEQLKKVLRSLVVSSPTAVDARSLLRDYRGMMGEPLPVARYGYRDPLQFLRERCSDYFLFQGSPQNPTLTPIVPESLKHIDEFVQKQKSKINKLKGKRRSVQEYVPPPQRNKAKAEQNNNKVIQVTDKNVNGLKSEPKVVEAIKEAEVAKVEVSAVQESSERSEAVECNGESKQNGGLCSSGMLRRFLQRRTPLYQSQQLSPASSKESFKDDDEAQTSSSTSSSRAEAWARLAAQVTELVAARPAGVFASELLRLYEEKYGRELNFQRFGHLSISAFACAIPGLSAARAAGGDWLVRAGAGAGAGAGGEGPGAAPLLLRRQAVARAPNASFAPVDPDEALPGIEYDADVFPADCLSFVESIPRCSTAGVRCGDMMALVVGEVYSPSHLWVLRLGPDYERMEDIMDEMTEYYTKGEGANRVLAAGARRPGQYCSSVFENDWHRSLIVQVVDSDTVKVRHIDYGTVDTVAAASLRPLRRAWGSLPALALRARLAGLRPPAASRRWPRAAAAHCLRLVRDRRLVGNVLAVDREEDILELFLIDTSTDVDVNISDELIRAGYADPRPSPALAAAEPYLFPLFAALEAGATPNYAEIHALLRDGIALDYVDSYRRHVPALLPDAEPSPPSPPAPPAPPALDRVPLPWAARGAPPAPDSTSESDPTPPSSPPASPEPSPSPPAASEPVAAPAIEPAPAPPPPPELPAAQSNADLLQTLTLGPAPTPRPPRPPPHPLPFYAMPRPPCPPYGSVSSHFGPPCGPATPLNGPCGPGSPFDSPCGPGNPFNSLCGPGNPFNPPCGPGTPFGAPCGPGSPFSPPCAPQFAPVFPQYRPQFHASTHMLPPPALHYGSFAQFPQQRPFPPYRPPRPPPSPLGAPPAPPAPRPEPAPERGAVKLTESECEIFELLSRVDTNAAHRYVAETLRRARESRTSPAPAPAPARASLNPLAAEFRVAAGTQTESRPPPGFE